MHLGKFSNSCLRSLDTFMFGLIKDSINMQNMSEGTSSLLLLFLFCLIVSACFFCCLFCCAFSFPILLLFLPVLHSVVSRESPVSFILPLFYCVLNKPFSSALLFVICLNQTACIHLLHVHNFKHLSDLFLQTFTSEERQDL